VKEDLFENLLTEFWTDSGFRRQRSKPNLDCINFGSN